MANGLTGTTGYDLAATTDTLIYTAPTGKSAVVTVSLSNRNNIAVKVRIARGTGASPANTDYLEYDATVGANTPLVRSGLSMTAGDKIWVRTDTINVTAQIDGFEA